MSDPIVDALRVKLKAAIEVLTPLIEGSEDLSSVDDLKDESKELLNEVHETLSEDSAVMQDILVLLDKLDEFGFPAPPDIEVLKPIYADLVDNVAGMNAILGRIHPLVINSEILQGPIVQEFIKRSAKP